MQDIADRAGVTRATVSNVLNEKYAPERAAAIRRASRIRRIAEEMGYRPSASARATRTGRTGLIGMIRSPSMGLSVHQPLFTMGLDEGLRRRGLCLVSELLDDSAEDAPRIVREKVVDGVIINYAFEAPEPIRDLLDRCQIPAVWVNCKRTENCVRPADQDAAFEATQHLIRHGHFDIEYLSTRNSPHDQDAYPEHYSQRDREAGYLRAMRQAGLSPRVAYLQVPQNSAERASGWLLKACTEYLLRPDRPSAVLGNLHGHTMLHAAEITRVRVPEDLSFMAFDDNIHADEWAKMDRMLVPCWSMGLAVVSELSALIENPDKPRNPLIVPFGFDETNTVARPGSRD